MSFNQWYVNRPGTLYFIPVTDIASVYVNLLLALFSSECGYFVVDPEMDMQPVDSMASAGAVAAISTMIWRSVGR